MNKICYLALGLLLAASCSKSLRDADVETKNGDYLGIVADGAAPGSSGSGGSSVPAGVITAGEWNDNANWEFWLGLMEGEDWQSMQSYWNMFAKERLVVEVKNAELRPVVDAEVFFDAPGSSGVWQARTNNKGVAVLLPNMFTGNLPTAGQIRVLHNGALAVFPNINISSAVVNITLQGIFSDSPNSVDVLFVVDATGSMGDELEYLKTELGDVTQRAQAAAPNMAFRYGSVFYRDNGDDYLTKPFDFSTSPTDLIHFIGEQSAGGGGDFPEAVDKALEKAINSQTWSPNARARLLFLVLDAPPHHEDQEVLRNMQSLLQQAAAKGIRIIPVTASGIDKETEFLMRFLALGSNGTYVFITDDSGIGDEHLKPTVGPYEVEYLNDLLVRLIGDFTESY